jgi:hypothetical protein
MLPPAVMWVDPGGMTGIALYTRSDEKLEVDEYPFQRAGEVLWGRMMHYRTALVVGWERFTILPDTHKLTPQPEAIEVIGVTRFLAGVFGCRTMTPAGQMTPDAEAQRRLKALGWWVPGKNDAQSAANHMLAWMLKANELPPRMREMIKIHGSD